jgi:hypothetical protein
MGLPAVSMAGLFDGPLHELRGTAQVIACSTSDSNWLRASADLNISATVEEIGDDFKRKRLLK